MIQRCGNSPPVGAGESYQEESLAVFRSRAMSALDRGWGRASIDHAVLNTGRCRKCFTNPHWVRFTHLHRNLTIQQLAVGIHVMAVLKLLTRFENDQCHLKSPPLAAADMRTSARCGGTW